MSDFCAAVAAISLCVLPIMVIILLIKCIFKKPHKIIKKVTIATTAILVGSSILGTFTDPATWCEHEYQEIEKVDATYETDGKIVRHCSLCDKTVEEIIERLTTHTTETTTKSTTVTASTTTTTQKTTTTTKPTTTVKLKETVDTTKQITLMMMNEDIARDLSNYPSTVKFKTSYWTFEKEGDTYTTGSTFECLNAFGVKEEHILIVFSEAYNNGKSVKPVKVFLDGRELPTKN